MATQVEEPRIRIKRRWKKRQMQWLISMRNAYLFTLQFWKDDLTTDLGRKDLPEKYRGKQVLTKEQRVMLLDRARQQQFCTGRKLGKTLAIESRYFWYPLMELNKPGNVEGMFYVPRQDHRDPVVGRIKIKTNRQPFLNMLKSSFNEGKDEFYFNGGRFVWYNRIEGNPSRGGQSMVGPRCKYMMGDEGAYGNDAAYTERVNTALPHAIWLWAGVPNGIRGTKFHRIATTGEGTGWSRHQYDIRVNILYHSLSAIMQLVREHGGVESQGFQTQVLGNWGEAAIASFPIIPTSDVMPFTRLDLTGKMVEQSLHQLPILLQMQIPEKCDNFVIGADVGFSPSPTVILIFAHKDNIWWEVARVNMLATSFNNQARVVDAICTSILPQKPARGILDAHIVGLPLLQALHELNEFDTAYYKERFIDAGFGTSMPDPRIRVHKKCNQRIRETPNGFTFCDYCRCVIFEKDIKSATIQVKQHLTIALKESMLHGQNHLVAMGYAEEEPLLPESAEIAQ